MPTKVIVLGGGVAGMSAAHELIERGFDVVVLERRDIPGGKARSIPVIDDGAGTSGHARADTGVKSIQHRLPGEHGFRFFPGFYKHVIDTMRRTPSFDGRHGVGPPRADDTRRVHAIRQAHIPYSVDLPAEAGRCRYAAAGYSPHFQSCHRPHAGRSWRSSARASGRSSPRAQSAGSANTSGSGGGTSSAPSGRSAAYQKFLATGFTRSLVAAKARKASARTVGDMFVQMMLTFLNPTEGATDRLLDGPTNLVWIDPWLSYLESQGVRYLRDMEVEQILCDKVRITGVAVRHRGQADVYSMVTTTWRRCRSSALLRW